MYPHREERMTVIEFKVIVIKVEAKRKGLKVPQRLRRSLMVLRDALLSPGSSSRF